MTKNERLRLVNKQYCMEELEVPKDLVIPRVLFAVEKEKKEEYELICYRTENADINGENGKKYVVKEVARALERLFFRADEEGQYLVAISGYRSYERQKEIYKKSIQKNGIEHAEQYSAKPGHSEHQTGLAMDISSETVRYELDEIFSKTKEYQWLVRNCWKEGFIIRYPKGKEKITGYAFEPWHIRYVGREEAEIIMRCNITLEEFVRRKNRADFTI